MRWDVFTLVPEAFSWFSEQHPISEAVEKGVIDFAVHDIREFTPLNHKQVDDSPYGGGPGMVIRVDVVAAALEGVFAVAPERVREDRDVLVMSPGGRPFDDGVARELAGSGGDVVLLCGRYEGFDARVAELFACGALSVGPYVLAGGELAAMAVLEACVRKMPGVLGNMRSTVGESFSLELVAAFVLAVLIQQFVVKPVYIPSPSMNPTLVRGDRVLVSRFAFYFEEPKPGDVIVFHPPIAPEEDYIKRVVAVEGDTVAVHDGQLYIDGEAQEEPYVESPVINGNFEQEKVPPGRVFVMGDNRNNSGDSRVFGPVEKKAILGKAFLIYWPLDKISWL